MRESKIDRDMASHCAALGSCRRCGHGPDVSPIVSAARRPKVMLVGQAPGKVEAAGGRPFAGRAGRTLFRWLERAGVDEPTARSRIYIAAVTRCYPGPSESGRGDRVPSLIERDNCAAWLDDELRILRPSLLIPVGRLAIERFLPPRSLEELIGREHEVEYAHGRAVAIPLPHPSGASSWIHQGRHPELLERALKLLAARFRELGVGQTKTQSVA